MTSQKSEYVYPPFSDGTNNSNVRYYATATTHATTALPDQWRNCWVEVAAETSDAYVLFGPSSSIEVDRSLTAASPKLGVPIAAGTSKQWWLPHNASHISVEAGSAGAVRVTRSEPLVPKGNVAVTGQ